MELVACQLRACEHVMLTAARTPASPQRTAHHAATARVPLPRPALHARFFATAPVSHASFCATWGFVAHVRNSFRYFASCGWKRPLVGEIRMFSEPKSPTKITSLKWCKNKTSQRLVFQVLLQSLKKQRLGGQTWLKLILP